MRRRQLASFSRWRSRIALAIGIVLVLAAGAVDAAAPTIKGDPQAAAEVQAALQKFAAARTWRSRMVAGDVTTTTEYVAPDRFHLTILQRGQRTEMFLIGRQIWMRNEAGCSRLPAAMPLMNPKEIIEHSAPDTTLTVSRLGPATVEGVATQTYAVLVESKSLTAREKLYVANTTGLPRRIEVQASRGSLLIDYSDFNAPITIGDPPC